MQVQQLVPTADAVHRLPSALQTSLHATGLHVQRCAVPHRVIGSRVGVGQVVFGSLCVYTQVTPGGLAKPRHNYQLKFSHRSIGELDFFVFIFYSGVGALTRRLCVCVCSVLVPIPSRWLSLPVSSAEVNNRREETRFSSSARVSRMFSVCSSAFTAAVR